MASEPQLPKNKVKKLLTQTIKQAISNSEIRSSTRSGNKELGLLVKKVAAAPFAAEADVKKVGTDIGEKIVELSKQSDKQSLDAGVVRRLALQPDWMAVFDIPAQNPTEKVSKKASKSSQTVITLPMKTEAPAAKTTPVSAASEPEPEPPVAEEAAVEAKEAAVAPVEAKEESVEAEEVAVEAEEAPVEAEEVEEEPVEAEEDAEAKAVAEEAKEEPEEAEEAEEDAVPDKTAEETVSESAAVSDSDEEELVLIETPAVTEPAAAEEE